MPPFTPFQLRTVRWDDDMAGDLLIAIDIMSGENGLLIRNKGAAFAAAGVWMRGVNNKLKQLPFHHDQIRIGVANILKWCTAEGSSVDKKALYTRGSAALDPVKLADKLNYEADGNDTSGTQQQQQNPTPQQPKRARESSTEDDMVEDADDDSDYSED